VLLGAVPLDEGLGLTPAFAAFTSMGVPCESAAQT